MNGKLNHINKAAFSKFSSVWTLPELGAHQPRSQGPSSSRPSERGGTQGGKMRDPGNEVGRALVTQI